MKLFKTKLFIFAAFGLFLFFLSNDFGLIDIEKTAIITALAVDIEDDEYIVSAQIAVPESPQNNTQDAKAQISGKGYTVGAAIKNLGDLSGWYPKMDFCNLIIIGKEIAETNALQVLDYFSKTLRIQDSAVVVQAENKAEEILSVSTPLDNISAFALQKAVLKTVGFNRDVVESNIKTFVEGYFSDGSSGILPLVKIVRQKSEGGASSGQNQGGNGSSGGSSGGSSSGETKTDGNSLFNPACTSLFYKGVKVGELDEKQTLIFNMLTEDFILTTLQIGESDVESQNVNYLLTVKDCNSKVVLTADKNNLTVNFDVKLYCKISDMNAASTANQYNKNDPLPQEIIEKTQKIISDDIESLILTEKSSGCDFLKIKEKLYRSHHDEYSRYKDNFLSAFDYRINVEIEGQK